MSVISKSQWQASIDEYLKSIGINPHAEPLATEDTKKKLSDLMMRQLSITKITLSSNTRISTKLRLAKKLKHYCKTKKTSMSRMLMFMTNKMMNSRVKFFFGGAI